MPGADRGAQKFIGVREVRNVVTWNRAVDLCAIHQATAVAINVM